MKLSYPSKLLLVSFLVIAAAAVGNTILAQIDDSGIQYPIQELGGCQDQASCKAYCSDETHQNACWAFAKNHNLMTDEEINGAKKFAAAKNERPGGCRTKDTCENYCGNLDHTDECIAFAEKHDLLPQRQLQNAKKIQEAIAKGIKPPACTDEESCDTYCDGSNHTQMQECILFGEAAGFLEGKELERAKKVLVAVKNGLKPPCQGKKCELFCRESDNMAACAKFAIEAGFMDDQEKERAQKMLKAIESGVKPPRCHGNECEAYCSSPDNVEECANFAKAAGFITPEQAESTLRTGGRGPGGCNNKDGCRAFCEKHEDECFAFTQNNGLAHEADLTQVEEKRQSFQRSAHQIPESVLGCLGGQVDEDTLRKIKEGSIMPSGEIGVKMRECFGQMSRQQEGQSDMMRNQDPWKNTGTEDGNNRENNQFPEKPVPWENTDGSKESGPRPDNFNERRNREGENNMPERQLPPKINIEEFRGEHCNNPKECASLKSFKDSRVRQDQTMDQENAQMQVPIHAPNPQPAPAPVQERPSGFFQSIMKYFISGLREAFTSR